MDTKNSEHSLHLWGSVFLWIVGIYLQVHTASQSTRITSTSSLPWEYQILFTMYRSHSILPPHQCSITKLPSLLHGTSNLVWSIWGKRINPSPLPQLLGWTESFCVFQMKSQSFFFNIFTIFNQLYSFHCLLLRSPNVSQAFQFRPCEKFLVLIQNTLG
jgi:hypothetical protein